jgi:tetratricopeptide (TPR) repeat protein
MAERVIPTLEVSERELGDPNASARLASAYAAARRYADAIAASTRGLARAPGPGGAARLLVTRASAEGKTGDVASARRDLDAATEDLNRVVVAGYRDAMLGQVKAEREALPKPN